MLLSYYILCKNIEKFNKIEIEQLLNRKAKTSSFYIDQDLLIIIDYQIFIDYQHKELFFNRNIKFEF